MKHHDIETLPRISQLKLDLIAAKALISDPDHWCRNTAQYNIGNVVQRCSDSALRATIDYRDARYDRAYKALLAAIPYSATRATSVERQNDTSSHAQVMAWWDRAIAAA